MNPNSDQSGKISTQAQQCHPCLVGDQLLYNLYLGLSNRKEIVPGSRNVTVNEGSDIMDFREPTSASIIPES